ncbi:hypothetical protein TWF102_005370 [Orbilia oligospora]|uniref:Uncharacterized protein n=1 Tax=Orbilia oligospora TaxID=2813651 RepID=A0A7C8JG90_ORBOL|nr:hypothetical protein TWF102_005370 [Orbilia oligospora]
MKSRDEMVRIWNIVTGGTSKTLKHTSISINIRGKTFETVSNVWRDCFSYVLVHRNSAVAEQGIKILDTATLGEVKRLDV